MRSVRVKKKICKKYYGMQISNSKFFVIDELQPENFNETSDANTTDVTLINPDSTAHNPLKNINETPSEPLLSTGIGKFIKFSMRKRYV